MFEAMTVSMNLLIFDQFWDGGAEYICSVVLTNQSDSRFLGYISFDSGSKANLEEIVGETKLVDIVIIPHDPDT